MSARAPTTAPAIACSCVLLIVFAADSAGAYSHNLTPDGKPVRWTAGEIRVVVDDSISAIGPVHAVEAIVAAAFETWIAEAELPMDFTVELGSCGDPGYHPDQQNTNCVMACTDCVAHGEDVGARALVSHVLETGEIVDADIVFFSDSGTWTLGHEPGAISVKDVALHEIGHVLGLGHSEVAEARMFASMSVDDAGGGPALHADDVVGAGALYPTDETAIETAGCGWRCTAASGAPSGLAGCLLFAAALALLRLRRRR